MIPDLCSRDRRKILRFGRRLPQRNATANAATALLLLDEKSHSVIHRCCTSTGKPYTKKIYIYSVQTSTILSILQSIVSEADGERQGRHAMTF